MEAPPSTAPTPHVGDKGRAFRAARQGAGLPIRKLAERADINHSTISRWERGEREVSDATYEHLTLALADFMAGRWAA